MSDESYLLFQGYPVLCMDGFTDAETGQLIELLEDQNPSNKGRFTSVKSSDCDAKSLIRLRRNWSALEPYLGEFDFGVFDPEPPDSFKRYVHINYEAAEFAREIEAIRTEHCADEKKLGFFPKHEQGKWSLFLREADGTERPATPEETQEQMQQFRDRLAEDQRASAAKQQKILSDPNWCPSLKFPLS